MRLALASLLLSLSSNALAGGFGILGTTGFYQDSVYFYDKSTDFTQYKLGQSIPTGGGGIEIILGDRDDVLMGFFRGYWSREAAQKDPAGLTSLVSASNVVAAWRDTARNVGVGIIGIQGRVFGDADGFAANVQFGLGSGFLTTDHTEFLQAEAGISASYAINRDVQAYVNANYVLRQRKGIRQGADAYLGLRYLFD